MVGTCRPLPVERGEATAKERLMYATSGRVTRARVLRAGVGTVAAGALAACGSEAAPARTKGPVTVTYISGLPETHPTGEARLTLMREFNKTNAQQITVDIEPARGT